MTAAGSWWGMGVQGKQLELGERGRDVARSLAALPLLLSAPGKCVGIFHSSFLTSAADWRWGDLSWKQVLCQRRCSQVLGKLLGGWEKFFGRKTSCILTESKKHWPPVIYSWDELEAKQGLCVFYGPLKFRLQSVRDKLTKAACRDFCLVPILWTGKF